MMPTAARRGSWRALLAAVAVAGTLFVTGEVNAAEAQVAVGEVSAMPASAGTSASVVRDVAAAEIEQLDMSRLPNRRKVVVSISVVKSVADKTIACTVNAMLRDARTGVMIAIIEAGAQAEGPASMELKKEVAHQAVRSAMRRIPRALGGK